MLSSVVRISFYFLSKRFFLKRELFSDARITSITQKEYGFVEHFLIKFIKSLKSKLMNDLMQFVEVLVCLEF